MRIRGLVVMLGVAGALMLAGALLSDCKQETRGDGARQTTVAVTHIQGEYHILRRSPAVRRFLHQEVLVLPGHLKELIKRLGSV